MSKVNTLLAKAMSTTSEEEAISCLRMARKHGSTTDGFTASEPSPKTSTSNVESELLKVQQIAITYQRMYTAEANSKVLALQKLQYANTKLAKAETKRTNAEIRANIVTAICIILALAMIIL